ncbi:glycosyltransferase family 2 protein [Flavobacterium sp.]|uniref:glycosyltransferase family 2 protein n=1 Tax=Flavobacterium sp. TaxID=239 RepID=UPI001B552730|nr:glycosyltransferase family 2 protein [Flavobacterium sp.]MBP6126995.1 glycosyltransferase family 2 protein [Flavobacterium sp.]
MTKTAVVILNWNGSKLLQQFLPSVLQFSGDATIYVADNASTDTSIDVLKNEFPTIKIIENTGNYGFAKGYNEALKRVEEPYYALVNSDIEVSENWLQPIEAIFDNEPNSAIIQPKLLDYKKKTHFEYAGAAGGFIDKYGFPFCRGRIFDTLEEDLGQYDTETEIFWATGACFFIRKEVFRSLQGFDGDFFAHQEEIDLCWRANNVGHTIKYCPTSVVYHVGGATLNEANPMKTFLNFRNSLLMLTKNLPKEKLVPIIFIRMCLDGLAGIQFLFQGKVTHTFAILKAHFYFYHLIGRNLKKRNNSQKTDYYYTKSIVWNYFVQKKNTFNRI